MDGRKSSTDLHGQEFADIVEDCAALLGTNDNADEVIVDKDHVGCFAGDIASGPNLGLRLAKPVGIWKITKHAVGGKCLV